MRSDDISMNFDSIAATSPDVSYGASGRAIRARLKTGPPASRSIVTEGMRTRRELGFAV